MQAEIEVIKKMYVALRRHIGDSHYEPDLHTLGVTVEDCKLKAMGKNNIHGSIWAADNPLKTDENGIETKEILICLIVETDETDPEIEGEEPQQAVGFPEVNLADIQEANEDDERITDNLIGRGKNYVNKVARSCGIDPKHKTKEQLIEEIKEKRKKEKESFSPTTIGDEPF